MARKRGWLPPASRSKHDPEYRQAEWKDKSVPDEKDDDDDNEKRAGITVDFASSISLREQIERMSRAMLGFSGGFIVDELGVESASPGRPRPDEDPTQRAERLKREAAARRRRELEELEARLKPTVEPWLLKTKHTTGWDDVVGNAAARRALIDAIETPMVHAELYRHYGKKPTKGVLLWGPPGNGKTLLAKAAAAAVARLAKDPGRESLFMLINGPSLQSTWLGETEQRIRSIFAYARLRAELDGHPMVIFIDEADAMLPPREQAYGYQQKNVATFLAEMDGLETNGALVILATNRPHHIDAALLRDGRCDRKIKVERPDQAAAAEIFRRCLAGVPIGAGLTAEAIAEAAAADLFSPERVLASLKDQDAERHWLRMSDIVSGAMMTGLVERAKENAFRRDLDAGGQPTGVTLADVAAAVETVQEENAGLDHGYAIEELVQRIGASAIVVEPMKPPALTRAEIKALTH